MYIYRGKLDFSPSDSQNAKNEGITTIFPSGFHLGDPVYTCWQWSTLGKIKNVPCWLAGIIDSVDNLGTGDNEIGFYGGDYRFDGFLSGSKCIEELSLMVRTGNVVGTAIKTKLVFRPDSRLTIDPDATVPHIYLGKLSNYAPYSIDQTLLVVIPGRTVGKGNTVCAFWQRSHGSTKVNVDHVTLKMTNVEKVADYVSFRFAHRNDYFTFDAIVGLTRGLKETAGQQHLTVAITTPHFSTGSLLLELRDLRPSPSGRQPRGVNDSASCPTTAINDTYKITTGSQNDGSVLMRSLVEMSSKIVELTNKPNEKFNDPKQTVRDRDGMSAQLESKLRAKQGENKLLKTMLLESLRALEEGRRTAQETKNKLRGVAKWKCLIPCK